MSHELWQETPPFPHRTARHTACVALRMAAPRRVLPGSTYLVTRRCAQRALRLRPSTRTNRIFLYCLAFAALKTGVLVHAVCVMSNHHHMVVTDVNGVLPDFLRELHRSVAKALNATQGQCENLWSVGPTSAVLLVSPEDVRRKIAYVVANPVDAGLVESPDDWPGVLLWGEERRRVVRPQVYFDSAGASPEAIELVVTAPSTARDVPGWREQLVAEISSLVADARRTMLSAGLRFLGRAGVLAASFVDRARSHATRRQIAPKVAAIHREARIVVLRQYRAFYGAYRAALDAWRGGDRSAVFPDGTWWMRVHHHAAGGSRVAA